MPIELKTITPGDNENFPKEGDRVTIHHTVMFSNGNKIDSTRDRNYPFVFTVGKGMVIKGWEEAIVKISLGEKVSLTCSSDLAYGENGIAGVIGPNEDLKFEIELIKIG